MGLLDDPEDATALEQLRNGFRDRVFAWFEALMIGESQLATLDTSRMPSVASSETQAIENLLFIQNGNEEMYPIGAVGLLGVTFLPQQRTIDINVM